MDLHTFDAAGVSIAYLESGDGPLTLLIHGFTGSAETMTKLGEDLNVSGRTISVDLIGHGRSDSPTDVAHYSMDAAVRHLTALIAETGSAQVDLVGYSLGGRVALSFAVAHPSRVRSLALIGATAGLADLDDAAARRSADHELAADIESQGVGAFVDRWMALPMWRSLESRSGQTAWAASRRQRLANSPIGLANSLRGMGTGAMPALHRQLESLEVPTLLVVGAEDAKFLVVAESLRDSLPDADLAIVKEAGHAAHLEQPGRTAAAISDHIIQQRTET
jgi:2-succinyl-6-hydroxy-2,4-cyclohexadiene-1-carboxylate synthase